MFLSEWREFPSAPCLAGKKNLMTVRISMSLKLRVSLTCFRACFLPGHAKDLSAPWYTVLKCYFVLCVSLDTILLSCILSTYSSTSGLLQTEHLTKDDQ